MKKLNMILIATLVLSFAVTTNAASLAWDPSTGTVEGYVVYYGEGAAPSSGEAIDRDADGVGVYNVAGNITRVDSIETLFSIPVGASAWFAVSAWNAAGESLPCAPVEYSREYEPRTDRAIDFAATGGAVEPASTTIQ
jgi:hypothetical protein